MKVRLHWWLFGHWSGLEDSVGTLSASRAGDKVSVLGRITLKTLKEEVVASLILHLGLSEGLWLVDQYQGNGLREAALISSNWSQSDSSRPTFWEMCRMYWNVLHSFYEVCTCSDTNKSFLVHSIGKTLTEGGRACIIVKKLLDERGGEKSLNRRLVLS